MPIPSIPGAPGLISPVAPGIDGQMQWYLDPALNEANINKFCIYINGILTSPADHLSTARQLSLLGPVLVLGVFNESNFSGATQFARYLRRIVEAGPTDVPAISVRPQSLLNPLAVLAEGARVAGAVVS